MGQKPLSCLTMTLFLQSSVPFSFRWDPKPCKILEELYFFFLFQGRFGSYIIFAPKKHTAGLVSQADSHLFTAFWVHPVALEHFKQDHNILVVSLNLRPLAFARVQINYLIVLWLSKCLYTSALAVSNSVIPSPLIKLNVFKTPEVLEALFTTWIKGGLSKGLWNNNE